MKYLYLDNFRGFSNTIVPLRDVNFLVGENSTGKTSLMGVFRMLSGRRIFTGQDSMGEDFSLGGFGEMVSAHSDDRSYFRMGFIADATYERKGPKAFAVLLTYKNIDGLAELSTFTTTTTDHEITFHFDGPRVLYRMDRAPESKTADELRPQLLKLVERHKKVDPSDYKLLAKGMRPDRGHYPLMWLLHMAASAEKLSETMMMPPMAPDTVWIAPIRTRPRRTHDEPQTPASSEGDHIPYVIKRILSSEGEAERFRKFMKEVGKASGLFQKIEVKHFGKSRSGPFEIDAYIDNKALGIHLMGYGVSQALPILAELLDRPKSIWFGIQQPEVHLHPRAQAALGDVFFEMVVRDQKSFLVETHSDYMIDRFRLNYGKKRSGSKLPESQILFFERKDKYNTVTPIRIAANGEMPADQPEGYRRFFIKEEMDLLGIR